VVESYATRRGKQWNQVQVGACWSGWANQEARNEQ
jgi:hypothetical protein